MVTTQDRTIPAWRRQVNTNVKIAGGGPPAVFLHGAFGLQWDGFLDSLAQTNTVYAPEHPGTTPDAPEDVAHLDGVWDLVLCYDELLEALGVGRAAFVGHSFGGMVACELAAAYPARAERLALIDPIGFWRDSDRIVNWMLMDPSQLRRQLFRDPDGDAARTLFGAPGDAEATVAARVRLTWAMGTTGKFIWPLPDKGLKKRIHRVKAPTLVLWGKDDRLVPPVYADEFTRRLPDTRVQMVDGAGHAPHLEQPEVVARMVRDFLGR